MFAKNTPYPEGLALVEAEKLHWLKLITALVKITFINQYKLFFDLCLSLSIDEIHGLFVSQKLK